MLPPVPQPDLDPPDERTGLEQRLDHYRAIVMAQLAELTWEQASSHPLPATDLTVGGVVRHLAWAEDRWFQARMLGEPMPDIWSVDDDDPDHSMRLSVDGSVDELLARYAEACARSRRATESFDSLDAVAQVPSFNIGPVNLRWVLVHMIDETARHAGHIDLLRDALLRPA